MPDLDGRASIPTWSRDNSDPGCFSARFLRRSICRRVLRNPTAVAVAGHVSMFARPQLSLHRTSSTHDGAFLTSQSSIKALSLANCVPRSETASSVATTALRFAPGTSLRARDARQSLRHAKRYAHLASPTSFVSTTSNSGDCFLRRRSNERDETDLFETC